jgi:leader peptidase (prepilin peptidase) / N-methyltransferase
MELTLAAAALVPGAAIGSFVGVLAARLPARRSVVAPASACDSCAVPIAWYDKIPLLSYVILRGRCRNCRQPIPAAEPLVELSTGLLFVGCLLAFGLTAQAAVAALFCAALVAVTATDLEHRIVPNRIVLPAAAAVLLAQTALAPGPEWVLAAAAASGALLLAAIAYPGGMGMGDVKLALLMGAMLGRSVAVALMLALVLALLPSVVLLVRRGAAARKAAIPFAPFLAAGSLVALFWGPELLDVYLALLR